MGLAMKVGLVMFAINPAERTLIMPMTVILWQELEVLVWEKCSSNGTIDSVLAQEMQHNVGSDTHSQDTTPRSTK